MLYLYSELEDFIEWLKFYLQLYLGKSICDSEVWRYFKEKDEYICIVFLYILLSIFVKGIVEIDKGKIKDIVYFFIYCEGILLIIDRKMFNIGL